MTSTGTQPVRDRAYWTAVIHNAARVNPDHPRYDEARQVIQVALDNLDTNARNQSAADTPPTPMPSKVRGAAMSAFQGLTSGFGDEALGGIAGLATLLTGGGPTQTVNRIHQTQEGFREQQGNFLGQHPAIAIASDLYGTAASPLNRILGPLTEGLGPVARGAVVGTTLGGLRGLGEGTGSVQQRLPAAGAGAAIGFVAGSVLGKAVKTVGPTVGRMAANVRKLLGPGATASEVDNVVEGTIRKRLAKLNVAAEDIETAIKSWRTTGELSVKRLSAPPPEPPAPPTVRAGETITPTENLNKSTFARRGGTVRQDYNPATGERHIVGRTLPDIGRGQTVPYYPRGGVVEQAFGTPPVSSMPANTLAPQQLQLVKQFLQGATATDLPSRLDVLRAIGIPLPADAEAQLLPMLTGGH